MSEGAKRGRLSSRSKADPSGAKVSKARALPFDPVKGEAFEIQIFSDDITDLQLKLELI